MIENKKIVKRRFRSENLWEGMMGLAGLLLKKKSLEKERYTITIRLRRYWKIIKTLVQYYYIFYLKGFYLGN